MAKDRVPRFSTDPAHLSLLRTQAELEAGLLSPNVVALGPAGTDVLMAEVERRESIIRAAQDDVNDAQAAGDVVRLRAVCADMYASLHSDRPAYANDRLGKAIRMKRTVEFSGGKIPAGHITFVIEPARNQPKGVVTVMRPSDGARAAVQPGDFDVVG